jgi:hypothetical protein
MPSNSSTVPTVAAIAAGCSLLAYGVSRLTKSSKRDLSDLDEIDDEEDCIAPDDVCAIFDKLFISMQQVSDFACTRFSARAILHSQPKQKCVHYVTIRL